MTDEDIKAAVAAMRGQVELALACAWLAITIGGAVLLTNLGPEPKDIIQARESLAVHRKLVQDHEGILRDNQVALQQVEAELARVRAARAPINP